MKYVKPEYRTEKITEYKYIICFGNIVFAELIQDVDGYYHCNIKGRGTYESHTLRYIADKMDEINKPYQDHLDQYFKNHN